MASSFLQSQLEKPIPMGLSWLLGSVMECRGRQALHEAQRPEVLETLRQAALIQSAESSNRIEGVTVEPDRLGGLVRGDLKPQDRPEEEIVGYRRALSWIHDEHERIAVEPETLRALHSKAQAGMVGDAGEWKSRPNDIIELLPNTERRVRFRTVPPEEVPERLAQLCLAYEHAIAEGVLPPLLAGASFVFDLTCIHPFRDGNGRVSRLVTLLLLYRHGFHVGRYVSVERVVEETKESYYDALLRSSAGWHDGAHDLVPWWSYFLSTVRQTYREFEGRVAAIAETPGAKSGLVRDVIASMPGAFTAAQVAAACPSVSQALIRKVLRELRDEGRLVAGTGRGAVWKKTRGG